MKCDHCGVKRFVCLMYNCTDLNICAFCSSDIKVGNKKQPPITEQKWRTLLYQYGYKSVLLKNILKMTPTELPY